MRIKPIRGRLNYIIGHNFSSLYLTDPTWLVKQTSARIQGLRDKYSLKDLQPVNGYLNSCYSMLYITISQVPVGRSYIRHVLRIYAYEQNAFYSKHLVYEEASDPFAGTCDLEASKSHLMMQEEV